VLIIAAIAGGVVLIFAAFGAFLYLSVSRAAKDETPRRRNRIYLDHD
jgi:hypothetical protein